SVPCVGCARSARPKARQALFRQPIAFSSSFELRAQCKHCACEFLLQYNPAESFNPNSISEATHAADALHRIVVVIRSGELRPLRPNNVRELGSANAILMELAATDVKSRIALVYTHPASLSLSSPPSNTFNHP